MVTLKASSSNGSTAEAEPATEAVACIEVPARRAVIDS